MSVRNWLLGLPGRYKKLLVVGVDLFLAGLTLWLAFSLRYEELFVPTEPAHWLLFAVSLCIAFPVFVRCGLYRAIFRYSGIGATVAITRAVAIYTLAFAASALIIGSTMSNVPRTIAIIQPFLFAWAVLAVRAVGGALLVGTGPRQLRADRENLLIFGAGVSGIQTVGALQASGKYNVVGFIDDAETKVGREVLGVRVMSRAAAEQMLKDRAVDSVLLAMPGVSRVNRNAILEWLRPYGAHVRSIPSVLDLATGRVTLSDVRELDIDDLLGRDPVPTSLERVARDVADQTVMVTGAGGSIGSELCRQLLQARPARLVMVEVSEFALYDIHKELEGICQRVGIRAELVPLICDVRDGRRVDELCALWRPASIYHAAAYKHVPLVEHNVAEGIANNTLGTVNVAQAAIRHGARRFVLISTDKAVRPTNVMGASKRLAEVALQAMAAESMLAMTEGGTPVANSTVLTLVRFGNVLGSSGSVVPLFRAQLANGGPLTVTHPDVTRYFMTIPEAAQLVLEAGAAARGGELFLLDMGEPVRIMDLARRVIELSGATLRDEDNPDGDIEISVTGLRHGEKLYEELLIEDGAMPTDHPRIMMARERTWPWAEFRGQLVELRAALAANDVVRLRQILARYVDGFAAEGAVVDLVDIERRARGVPPAG